ncbi:MAG TPA: peptidylprolyl isomerase [Bryobacteraceae bacterium]|nr:peptidylprolyl isomerase [Bryobacteraceae bacterium]
MMRLLAVFLLLAAPAWAGKSAKASGELKPGLYAVFDTSEGRITAELFEKYTPIAVKNFVGLAQGTKPWRDPKTHAWVRRPMYNGITFHRIIREEMIQSGDPTGTGAHDCGFTIPDEFLPGLPFDRPGRLAVANTGRPNSGACQFFITDGAVMRWNNTYTVFGQVVEGTEVVHAINRKPLMGDRPEKPVILRSVTILRISRQ